MLLSLDLFTLYIFSQSSSAFLSSGYLPKLATFHATDQVLCHPEAFTLPLPGTWSLTFVYASRMPGLFQSNINYFLSGRISCTPGWLLTLHVAEDYLVLLTLLSLPPQCWGYAGVRSLCTLGVGLRVLYMPNTTHWATFQTPLSDFLLNHNNYNTETTPGKKDLFCLMVSPGFTPS